MLEELLSFSPPVIAHRGVCAHFPENTMPAFRAAVRDGATWIEADVKLTADGTPILMHDDLLDRTTNGKGPVSDATWAQINALDAGAWLDASFAGTRVATLAELLIFARENKIRLNLQLKPCPGRALATAMVSMIETARLWTEDLAPPLISSFDIEALEIAKRLHPGWPRGLLLDFCRDDWPELVKRVEPATLNITAHLFTPEQIAALCKTGLPVLTYTVNDGLSAQSLFDLGVSAVFSDNPGQVIRETARPWALSAKN